MGLVLKSNLRQNSLYYVMQISVFICFIITLFSQSTLSIKLESDGSYHVVVGIDRKTAKNNIEDYIPNIKWGLQRLSDLLYLSTSRKLHIKYADIVVPEHWNVPQDEIASTQYFENSDIRISHEFHEPYVLNPTLCGSSGEYMQLPYDFFNVNNFGGKYGLVGSALLTQWARYRYGVWEEHGFPLDVNFPYFFQNLGEDAWRVNYCSNIELTGNLESLNGGTCIQENPLVNPPPYHCRFQPNSNQSPSSSIMSFHFMHSISEFCNDATHNKRVPNRQNRYCHYQSVQHVIESSADWNTVTAPNPNPQAIQFKVVKMTKKPLLSLVLDGSLSQAPLPVMTRIKDILKSLGDGTLELPRDVIVNVASFSAAAESTGNSLKEELPWSDIRQHHEDFLMAIDSSFGRTSGFRNFALAIKQALDNIRHRKHEFGSVMVIVKTGAATNFDKIYYEDEIIGIIKELGIKIYTFEVYGNDLIPGLNLANWALGVGGSHLTLRGPDDLNEMATRMESIAADLNNFPPNPDKKFRSIYKGVVTKEAVIELNAIGVSKLNFHLMPINNAPISDVAINQIIEEQTPPPESKAGVSLQEKIDWHIPPVGAGATRKTFAGVFTYVDPERVPETWKVTYTCSGSQCSAYLFIYGEMQTETELKMDEIDVIITTTAVNGLVDLDKPLQFDAITKANTPFGIYAKLQHEGFPVMNVGDKVSVKAIINSKDTSLYWTVELVDNGQRIPDIEFNDGIFSGSFIPTSDGVYFISVTINFIAQSDEDPGEGGEEGNAIQNSGRIISNDQSLIGCGTGFSGCWATVLPFDFMKVVDYTQSVTFINKAQYWRVPQKILDFIIIPRADYVIELQWTHPGTVYDGGIDIAHEYEIRHNEHFDKLLTNFSDCTLLPTPPTPWPSDPGTRQILSISIGYNVSHYYAIKSVYWTTAASESPVSNIVGILSALAPSTPDPVITPKTTTTTSTTTTTTTTEPPTTTPILPTETTTSQRSTVTTSRYTTSRTSTTKRPITTTRRTTTIPTTTETPVEHWFKKPEGYLTLIGFGVGVLVLIFVVLGFMWWRKRDFGEAEKGDSTTNEGPTV